MGKFIGGIAVGILTTLAGWFAIFLYGEVTRPFLDQIHAVKDYETGKVHLRGGFDTPRVHTSPDGKLSCTTRRNDKGDLDLEVWLTPDVTIEHACLNRNTEVPWNGMLILDKRGQRWEHVGKTSSHTEYRKKYGDEIALAQGYWIGRIRTDGKDVFFEDVYDGKIRSTWRKLSEPIVIPK